VILQQHDGLCLRIPAVHQMLDRLAVIHRWAPVTSAGAWLHAMATKRASCVPSSVRDFVRAGGWRANAVSSRASMPRWRNRWRMDTPDPERFSDLLVRPDLTLDIGFQAHS
jgi:hypothetical protein